MSPADAALLLAVCRGDVEGAAAAIASGASAKRRFRRADAAAALGPDAYLGSQWWATQTNFPLMYFVGASQTAQSAVAHSAVAAARAAPTRRGATSRLPPPALATPLARARSELYAPLLRCAACNARRTRLALAATHRTSAPAPRAGKWGSAPCVRLLIFGGARAGDRTSLGVTGLHMAAQEGNAAVADALLRAGASPDFPDTAGWTALHYAANHRWASWGAARPVDGQAATIALLAAARAQAGALDDESASAMHAAAHSGRPELVAALRDAGVPVTGPAGSYVRCCSHMMRQHCVLFLTRSRYSQSPVHVAATHGRVAVVAQLLSWAPECAHARDETGATPLRLAAEFAHADVVLALARAGASVRGPRRAGTALGLLGAAHAARLAGRRCPLRAAAEGGDVATCAVLVALGARAAASGAAAAAAATATRRARAAAHAVTLAGRPNAPPEAAARAEAAATRAANAAAASAMLRMSAAGVPLRWLMKAEVHLAFPEPFRERVKEVLRALHRTPLRQLPLPLRDRILCTALEADAAEAAWPCLDDRAWALVAAAEGTAAVRAAMPPAARAAIAAAAALAGGGAADDPLSGEDADADATSSDDDDDDDDDESDSDSQQSVGPHEIQSDGDDDDDHPANAWPLMPAAPGLALGDPAMQMHIDDFVPLPVPPGGGGAAAGWAAVALEEGLAPLHLQGQFA